MMMKLQHNDIVFSKQHLRLLVDRDEITIKKGHLLRVLEVFEDDTFTLQWYGNHNHRWQPDDFEVFVENPPIIKYAAPWKLFKGDHQALQRSIEGFEDGGLGKNAVRRDLIPYMEKWLGLICRPEETGIAKIKAAWFLNQGCDDVKAFNKYGHEINLHTIRSSSSSYSHATLHDQLRDQLYEVARNCWYAIKGTSEGSRVVAEFNVQKPMGDYSYLVAKKMEE